MISLAGTKKGKGKQQLFGMEQPKVGFLAACIYYLIYIRCCVCVWCVLVSHASFITIRLITREQELRTAGQKDKKGKKENS